MNVFIFLFSGIYFLLLFLFTSVKITCDIDVGIFKKSQQLGGCVDGLSLANQSTIDQIVLADKAVKFCVIVNLSNGLRTIKLM